MRNIVKALALLLLVVFAVPAGAQSLTGTVTGTVKDEQGGALPGVSVILSGNTANNLLNFAPGINNSSAYGGDASSGNGLLIDGVDTRDPSGGTAWTFYNYNIVEEVQFTGIGAAAEYGAFTGAVVNTITKSGGNRFSGLFDVIYTKSSLASSNAPASAIALNPNLGQVNKVNKLVDFTTQISGPIIKDKLFVFASAQRYQLDQDPIGPRTINNEA